MPGSCVAAHRARTEVFTAEVFTSEVFTRVADGFVVGGGSVCLVGTGRVRRARIPRGGSRHVARRDAVGQHPSQPVELAIARRLEVGRCRHRHRRAIASGGRGIRSTAEQPIGPGGLRRRIRPVGCGCTTARSRHRLVVHALRPAPSRCFEVVPPRGRRSEHGRVEISERHRRSSELRSSDRAAEPDARTADGTDELSRPGDTNRARADASDDVAAERRRRAGRRVRSHEPGIRGA